MRKITKRIITGTIALAMIFGLTKVDYIDKILNPKEDSITLATGDPGVDPPPM